MTIPTWLLLASLLLANPAAAELVLYTLSGNIYDSSQEGSSHLGKPYCVKILYTTTPAPNPAGFYDDAIRVAYIELGTDKYAMEFDQQYANSELRVQPGYRFEASSLVYPILPAAESPSGYTLSKYSDGYINAELILEDNDGLLPSSSTPPLSLPLAEFEIKVAYFYLSLTGQPYEQVTGSVDQVSFEVIDPASLLSMSPPTFQISPTASTNYPYRYQTFVRIQSTLPGLILRCFRTSNLMDWTATNSNTFQGDLGQDIICVDQPIQSCVFSAAPFRPTDPMNIWPEGPRSYYRCMPTYEVIQPE